MAMVAVGELRDGDMNFFAIPEEAAVARLFRQDSPATPDHAIGIPIGNEIEDRSDAPERQLVEKVPDPTLNPASGSLAHNFEIDGSSPCRTSATATRRATPKLELREITMPSGTSAIEGVAVIQIGVFGDRRMAGSGRARSK
jgi:hypothetical protein